MDIAAMLNGINENVKSNVQDELNDYMGENGLLYCGNCHTPKQCKIKVPMYEDERIVFCLCECKSKQQEQEENRVKEKLKQEEIQRNRRTGIKDVRILQYTFENDEAPESDTSIKLKKYCSKHERVYENNLGLMLYGECGVGKSFYAGCVANDLINKGESVLCTTIPKILNGLFSAENKNAYINDIISTKFLILDDLGTERGTDYALEQLFTVIDERYKSNKPVIITTNLTPKEMLSNQKLEYKRIYSRILEMCTPLKVEGSSKRKSTAIDKSNLYGEIFG